MLRILAEGKASFSLVLRQVFPPLVTLQHSPQIETILDVHHVDLEKPIGAWFMYQAILMIHR